MNDFMKLSAEDRNRYLGNTDQMYGVRRMQSASGSDKGTTEFQVTTGGGLSYTVTADNGMDLGALSYRGINLHFLSKNGFTAPALSETYESGFTGYFPGGMMYTCGLMNAGGACRDGDDWHTAHGRYHLSPSYENGAVVDGDCIRVRGKVREARFSGYCLEIDRLIESPVGSSALTISDTLTNLTPTPTEYMLIYHFNFGYPFLSPSLKLCLPEGTQSEGKTPYATAGMADKCVFSAPVDGDEERLYLHTLPIQDGLCSVTLENSSLGIGARLSYSADTLPLMAQWKCMRSGEYVLGLEPTNNHILGRAGERENGTLSVLEPFGKVHMTVRLAFFDL